MDEGCVGLEQQFEGELQLPGDGGRAADLADSDVGKRHAVGVVGGDGGVGIAEAGCVSRLKDSAARSFILARRGRRVGSD